MIFPLPPESDSTLYYTPQKQILHCVIHRRNILCIDLYTAESNSALCYTPQKQTLYCIIHRRNRFCIVLYTAETVSALSYTLQKNILPCVLNRIQKSAICRTLQKQILQCAGHRKNKLSDEQDTAESEWKHPETIPTTDSEISLCQSTFST